ncbi:MAG: hypothetical protein HYS25_09010 [Ignavibacteriales bacterium]|nr:hypothetical protein [Ignavibacteriales bacterium]
MKKKIIYLLLPVLALFVSCGDNGTNNIDNQNSERVFYSNSFESETDISGWQGLTKEMIADEAFPANGQHSLHISGACLQPAASIELDNTSEGMYKLKFWAKMGQPSQSAALVLKTEGGDDNKIEITANSLDWRYYESENYIQVPVDKKMILEIWVGGIVSADVYIDNLKIEKYEPLLAAKSVYKSVINVFK